MRIEKAIEILEQSFNDPWVAPKGNFGDAIKLGIEALKRISSGRNPERRYVCYLLPGETTEAET